MKTTRERLLEIMKERHLRQVDVLKLCKPYCAEYGIKIYKSELSQYISGKNEPKQKKLLILSKALNVSIPYLMGFDVPARVEMPPELMPVEYNKKLPILGSVACGIPNFEDEVFFGCVDTDVKADFCLYARGDSMINAGIFDGDLVFVKQQPIVGNGQIAVISINNEITLKRFYDYKTKIVLRPENPDFQELVFDVSKFIDFRILGLVVAVQRQIR